MKILRLQGHEVGVLDIALFSALLDQFVDDQLEDLFAVAC